MNLVIINMQYWAKAGVLRTSASQGLSLLKSECKNKYLKVLRSEQSPMQRSDTKQGLDELASMHIAHSSVEAVCQTGF